MRKTTILTAAAIGLIGLGLSGCDEPAYEGAADERPVYTPEPEPQEAAPRQQAVGSGQTSTLGKARGAAERTVDRAQQQQQRALDEIDDD